MPARVMWISRLVAHPVRELDKGIVDLLPSGGICDRLLERAAHAKQPGVPLGDIDRETAYAAGGAADGLFPAYRVSGRRSIRDK